MATVAVKLTAAKTKARRRRPGPTSRHGSDSRWSSCGKQPVSIGPSGAHAADAAADDDAAAAGGVYGPMTLPGPWVAA